MHLLLFLAKIMLAASHILEVKVQNKVISILLYYFHSTVIATNYETVVTILLNVSYSSYSIKTFKLI